MRAAGVVQEAGEAGEVMMVAVCKDHTEVFWGLRDMAAQGKEMCHQMRRNSGDNLAGQWRCIVVGLREGMRQCRHDRRNR